MAITDQDRRRAFDTLLAGLPCLRELPEADTRYFLLDEIRPINVGPRTVLFEQDRDVSHLYFIEQGAVYQSRAETGPDGQPRLVLRREVGAGTLLARYDLLYDQQHSTKARSQGVCRLIKIDAAAFSRLLYRFPSVRNQLAPLHRISRLRTMPLLGDLTLTALSFVADTCAQISKNAGEVIFAKHEPANYVFLIDQGQVLLRWPDGRQAWLGNGAAFGFLDETLAQPPLPGMHPYGHDAISNGQTSLIKIPRKALIETADIHPEEAGHRLRSEREHVMEGLSVFADFTPEQRRRLLGYASAYHIPTHHLLMQQGEIGDSMWVLMPRRLAMIHSLDESGNHLPSTPVIGPIFFSELALRLQQELDSTVEAAPGSQWMRFHWSDFQAYLRDEKNPELAKKLRLGSAAPSLLGDEAVREHHAWLQEGETIRLLKRRHWLVLIKKTIGPLIAAAVVMTPVLLLLWFFADASSDTLAGLAIAAVIVALLWAWVDYRNDFLVLTNQRVVRQEKMMFITEWRQEAFLEQIQNIDSGATFWGNVFGYGDVKIQTAGTTGAIIFDYVPAQEKVKQTILNQVSGRRRNYSAEGKLEIQKLLEARLGLKLVMPSRVRSGAAADAPPPAQSWWQRLRHSLRRRSSMRQTTGDRIIWRKHWAVLVGQLIWPVLLLSLGLIVILGGFELEQRFEGFGSALEFVAALGSLAVLGWIAWIIADWHNDTYEVGTTHIVDVSKKPLFFAEQRRTARLGEIENVEMDIPSPLHYLLDYGNVMLQTAATEGSFTFDWVPNPRGVTEEIQRRIQAYHREEELRDARQRAQGLPDWFEMYNRMNADAGLAGSSPVGDSPRSTTRS